MEYEWMVPPFGMKNFREMNKNEAKNYFDWFISQIENRIEYLKKYIERDCPTLCLDYSVESLIPLWGWYENKIVLDKIDDAEYEKELEKRPAWVRPYITNDKISYGTLKISLDVSIYFAEVIKKNSAGKIYWTYFTKPINRISVNQPVLMGFGKDADLDPHRIVNVATWKSAKEKDDKRLYNLYHVWMKHLPE